MAGIPFQVHPHQLPESLRLLSSTASGDLGQRRSSINCLKACGYYLAASGHDTRAIQDYLQA